MVDASSTEHVISARDAFARMTVLNQLRQSMHAIQERLIHAHSESFDQVAVTAAIEAELTEYYRTFWPSILETRPSKKSRPIRHVLLPHEASGAGRNYVCYTVSAPEADELRYVRAIMLPPLRFKNLVDSKPHADTRAYVHSLFNVELKKLPNRGNLSPALRRAGFIQEYSLAPIYAADPKAMLGAESRKKLVRALFNTLLPTAYIISEAQEEEIFNHIGTVITDADYALVSQCLSDFQAYVPPAFNDLLAQQSALRDTGIVNFITAYDTPRRFAFLRDYPWAAFSQLHHHLRDLPDTLTGDAPAAKIFGLQNADADIILPALKRLQIQDMPNSMARRPTVYTSKIRFFLQNHLPRSQSEWQIFCDAVDRDEQFAQLRLRGTGETLTELVALSAEQTHFWPYLRKLTADLGAVPAMADRHGRELILPFLASMARDRGWHELDKNEDFVVLACMARGLKAKPVIKVALDAMGGKPLISLLYKDWTLDVWASAAKQFEMDSKYTARPPSGEAELVPSLLSLRTEGIKWKPLPSPPRTIEQNAGVLLVPLATLSDLWHVSAELRSTRVYEAADVLLGRAHFLAGYMPAVGLVAIARINEDKRLKSTNRLHLIFNAASDVEAIGGEMLMARNLTNSDTQRRLGRVAEAVATYVTWLNEAPLSHAQTKKKGYAITQRPDEDNIRQAGYQPIPADSVSPSAFEHARKHWVEQSEKARGLSAVCGGNPFDNNFNAAMTRMHAPFIPEGFDMRTTTGAITSQTLVQAVDTMMRAMRNPQPGTPAFRLVKR